MSGTRALTGKEIKRLFVVAGINRHPERNKAIMAMCCYSCLRIGETTNLTNKQVIGQDGTIRETITTETGNFVHPTFINLCYFVMYKNNNSMLKNVFA